MLITENDKNIACKYNKFSFKISVKEMYFYKNVKLFILSDFYLRSKDLIFNKFALGAKSKFLIFYRRKFIY